MFNEVLHFVKTKVDITNQEMSIIMQSRNTLLFNKNQSSAKKSGNEEFDVPMGCFDGAELCEIIGIYILKIQRVLHRDNAGLYKNDGFGVTKELPGPEMETKRKQIIEIFKMLGLSITIKMNLHVVDFLDIQFNNIPAYIDKTFNYPPQVLKELPKTIEK